MVDKELQEKMDSGGVKLKDNVYSTLKIFAHPQTVIDINNFKMVPPTLVQLMLFDLCNHSCTWCSYRRPDNKNNELFENSYEKHIPREKLLEMIDDFKEMGVKAIEMTGGGEPSLHPNFVEVVNKMVECGFDMSIVSNGSKLTEDKIKALSPNMLWARISVDAGNVDDYVKIRRVDKRHWDWAWKAVENLRKYGKHPEFALGVGHVVCPESYLGIIEHVRLAKEHGAHNVRISAAFTEQNLDFYTLGAVGNNEGKTNREIIKISNELAEEAKAKYEDKDFKVFNLFGERINNMETGKQDYDFCVAKEVVVVLTGSQEAYTCCSLAFNSKGLIGSFKNQRFKDLWFSKENEKFFRNHDPRETCKIQCLYESRNKAFLEHQHSGLILPENTRHKNFI